MEAVSLVLTDDFEFGAMLPAGRTSQCKGDGQFEEKVCRHHVNSQVSVCDGKLLLQLFYDAWPRLERRHAEYDAVVWGAGRHPTNGDYNTRHGVANASLVIQEIVRPICSDASNRAWISGAGQGRQRVFWLPSHARLRAGLSDEQPQGIKRYNDEMCNYFRKYHMHFLEHARQHNCQHSGRLRFSNIQPAAQHN